MPKKAQNFFTIEEEKKIIQSIKSAEKNTSGEIRVHLDNSSEINEIEKAEKAFIELRMHETALRNGVLFHFSVQNKTFSIIADKGINDVVSSNFWEDIITTMKNYFQEKKFCEGLCEGILLAGKALYNHFPFHSNDLNELSDEISEN